MVSLDVLNTKHGSSLLRYYYAIVTFDSPSSAAVAHSELDGTELERSANLFDLSYVPESMEFDEEPRWEATSDQGVASGLDFVTDVRRNTFHPNEYHYASVYSITRALLIILVSLYT